MLCDARLFVIWSGGGLCLKFACETWVKAGFGFEQLSLCVCVLGGRVVTVLG